MVIGDKIKPTLSDKDTIEYALEVLDRKKPGDKGLIATATAGDEAYQKWLAACDTTENTIKLFSISDIFTHALFMNSIYTQKCILAYYKKLSITHDRNVNGIVIQMDIASGRIKGERNSLKSLKDNPEEYANACRNHIRNLLRHREYMRGWLKELVVLLDNK